MWPPWSLLTVSAAYWSGQGTEVGRVLGWRWAKVGRILGQAGC